MRWATWLILLACVGVAGIRAGWGRLSGTLGIARTIAGPSTAAAARTTYDPSSNRTVVNSGPVQLPGGFTASAFFALSGRATSGTPLVPGVTLTLVGPFDVAKTGTGEIVDLTVRYGGAPKHKVGRITQDARTASVAMPVREFAALADAEDAAVVVGASTVQLTPEARAAFRRLAAQCGNK
jgi:hypothetical protein